MSFNRRNKGQALSNLLTTKLHTLFFRSILLLLLTTNCLLATAQSFPVQVIPQATPPSPIYFSDYADASTISSPLRVQIILNDFEVANREIRLRTYFSGGGINFQSNDFVVGAEQLFLEGGTPLVLTNVQLAPYFRLENITGISPNVYGKAIPEGAYTFCFEVFDVLTGNRLSQRSCATSVVFQNDPPFLVSPRNKDNIAETNPQNIVFQWTPRHINVSNVEYELSIVEIWDTQVDPQQAFLSSPPVFSTTTSATTYVYGPADPLFLSGKNYAWRIQAKAKQGIEEIGLFKNQGYSEIYSFSYATSCDLPIGISHEVKGSTNANIFWDDFSTDIPEYTLRYRQKNDPLSAAEGGNEWFPAKTTTNELTLWDLKPGTTYEYQLSKKCAITQSDWSILKEFTTSLEFEEESVLDCGVSPDINLTNMEPLASIGTGATFKAGDFPVKIMEVSGSNGRFTGKGYVTLPYLKNIKVAVEFTNILINTNQEMAEGSVRTAYDASWGNILDTAEAAEQVGDFVDAVVDLGDSVNDILKEVFNTGDEDEENAPPIDSEVEEVESVPPPTETSNENEGDTNTPDASGDSGNQESSSGSSNNNSNGSTPNTGGSTGDNSSDNPNPDSNEEDEQEVVIIYNGSEYRNGETITVPYDKNNSHYALTLKNYPDESSFNWQILQQGTDYTSRHVTNEPKYDNLGIDMKKTYILDVVANYGKQQIKVTLRRELQDFGLVDLDAKPEDSPKRIAKSGEKLYLVKKSLTKANRKVDFSVHIDPKLSQGDISSQDITWYYETPNTQYNLGKNYGKKHIHLNLEEQEANYQVNVKAGKPNIIEKGIDVVWVDQNYNKNGNIFSFGFDLMPHLKELAKKVGVPVYHEEGKYATDTGFSILAYTDFLTESRNIEDKASRLVFNEIQQTHSVTAGLKGRFEKGIPYLSLPQVKKSYLGVDFEFSVGVFFFMEASVAGKIGHTKIIEDWAEEKEIRNRTYLKVGDPNNLSLAAKIGLDPKLVLKASKNITGTISAMGYAQAVLFRADFANETYSSPLIDEGFDLVFKPTINFKFYDWGYTYIIDEKIYNVRWDN